MAECEFCGEEFDSEEEMHRHWEEHEEELNSHQKDEMKSAKRKKEEQEKTKMRKRKKYAGYGLAAIIGLAFVGVVGSQLMNAGGGTASNLSLEGEPSIGNESAPVTVVEFGDYRCPFCGRFHSQVYKKLKTNYIDTGKVEFYFVNYAFLDSGFPGRTSNRAAVAGECVYRQDEDQFWNFHGEVYETQGRESTDWATEDFLLSAFNASTSGLDYSSFRQCLTNRETSEEVSSDKTMGRRNSVSSTPTVFVNGEQVQDWSYSALSQTIEREINNGSN